MGFKTRSKKDSSLTGALYHPAGGTTVCIPDDKPTLVEAVEGLVKMYVGTKTKFSAYDITKALRKDVVEGSTNIDTSETGTIIVAGKDVARIDHEEIKGIVHDIFHRGDMDGFERDHTGEYWAYAPQPVDVPNIDPTPQASGSDYDGTSSL